MRFPIVHKSDFCNGNGKRVFRRTQGLVERRKKWSGRKSLDGHAKAWVARKIEPGIPAQRCFLPFLIGAPRLVECHVCQNLVYPGEEVLCSVCGCQEVYHLTCAKERLGFSSFRKFKCHQHACFICKQKLHWQCVRCTIAAHDKCSPFPEHVIHVSNKGGKVVCWRHPTDWRLEEKHVVPANDMEEIFCRLPLPYIEEDFKIDLTWKDMLENKMEPAPVHCISCSKACHCSEICTNRPVCKEKNIRIVKTELCGWGVGAAESINKGDFVIEYIGEGSFPFVRFRPKVKCHCGAANCRGYLGAKRKVGEVNICWGSKRKRSSTVSACLAVIKL